MLFLYQYISTFELLIGIDICFLLIFLWKNYTAPITKGSKVAYNFLIIWTLFADFETGDVYCQLETNFIQDRWGINAHFIMMIVEDHMLVEILLCAEIFEIFRLIHRHYMISCSMEQLKREKIWIKWKFEINFLLLICHIQAKDFFSWLNLIKFNSCVSYMLWNSYLYFFTDI